MSALITGEIVNLYLDTDYLGVVIISIIIMILTATLFRVAFQYGKMFSIIMSVLLSGLFIVGYKNVNDFNYKICEIEKLKDGGYGVEKNEKCKITSNIENDKENNKENSGNIDVYGKIYNIQEKNKSIYIYIDEVNLKVGENEYLKADKFILVLWKDEVNSYFESDLKDGINLADKEEIQKINSSNCETDIQIGRYISASGWWSEFTVATNEGEFDERKYNHSLGIQGKIEIYEYKVFFEEEIRDLFLNKLYKLRLKLENNIEEIADEKNSGIYKGILLGDRSSIDESVNEIYRISGISHILSISGLHISLIGYFIFKKLRKCRGFIFSATISEIVIIAYSYMIGAGYSTKRAVIMFCLNMIANMCGNTYDLISALGIAAICILLDSPLAILNTGFLLSFLASIGISILLYVIAMFLDSKSGLEDTENNSKANSNTKLNASSGIKSIINLKFKVLTRLVINLKLKKKLKKNLKALLDSITTCITVNAMLLPVLINSYNEISIYSVVVNILILSLVSVMVGLGFAGLLLSFLNTTIAKIVIWPGCRILDFYEIICKGIRKLPYSLMIVSDRSLRRIVLYYILLFFFLVIIWKINKKRNTGDLKNAAEFRINMIKRYVFLCIGISMLSAFLIYTKPSEFEINMLDVGQGDSIVITSDNTNIIIDAGSSTEKELTKYTILPFLKSKGISNIDYLVLTHSDSDHMSGFRNLLEYNLNGMNYVKNVILPDIGEDVRDDAYREIEEVARKLGIGIIYFSRGESLYIDNIELKCLWPIKKDISMDKNSLSMVIRLSFSADKIEDDKARDNDIVSMLLTGDLTKEGEKKLIELSEKESVYSYSKTNDLRNIDILKVAHHGSKDSSAFEFLKIAAPEIALISCGRNNRYGHPHEETINRLEKVGCDIKCTADSGGIKITFKKGKLYLVEFN